MTTEHIKPEHRDVEFALKLAIASLRDYERCRREYGWKSDEAKIAWGNYARDEKYWLELKKEYENNEQSA